MKKQCLWMLMPLLLVLLSGCGDNFFSYRNDSAIRRITKGKGEWNIEQLDAWLVSRNGSTFLGKVSKSDVGVFTFKEGERAALRIHGGDVLDMQYFDIHSVDDAEWMYTTGLIDLPINMSGYVTMMDNNEMEIICPYTLNSWLSYKGGIINARIEMKFKLRKK